MVLKEKLNNDNNFSNSMKIEYKNEKKLLMNIKNNLFFNIVDANNLLKFKYFYIIDNKYNFDNDNEYIHFYSYRNPLKRNYM